jgi:hypothetical protein
MAGKRKKKKRNRRREAETAEFPLWMDEEGVHAMLPGAKPDAETLERMSRAYQEKIRNSPLWDEMVRQFGAAKAEELLGQFRAEVR